VFSTGKLEVSILSVSLVLGRDSSVPSATIVCFMCDLVCRLQPNIFFCKYCICCIHLCWKTEVNIGLKTRDLREILFRSLQSMGLMTHKIRPFGKLANN